MEISPDQLLKEIAQLLCDKKAHNILALDLQGISSITDYLLIADGTVDRHVIALAGYVREKLKAHRMEILSASGEANGDWIVLDSGTIMVHLFTPQLRDYYRLEELWKEGQLVDLKMDFSEESRK